MSKLPERIPPCAAKMLDRPGWFADSSIIGRAKLGEATGLAWLLSSRFFAHQEIAAITLGYKIGFRMLDSYDPHTARGLALLAHELKHVEQYKKDGCFRFYAKYIWAYVLHSYGPGVPFEAEAVEFQRQVKEHLEAEFERNPGRQICLEMDEPHTPNAAFVRS
jgi:Domain of unknown function (DUF4157)